MTNGRGPEVRMDGGHAFVQCPTGLDVGRRLEDVELLQVTLHRRSTVAEDLAPVEHDSEIRQVRRLVLQPNEVVPDVEEAAQDGETCLSVGLAPFPSRWVVVLQ